MNDKLIKLAGLYRNVSQRTGREYFTGNLTLFSKVVILENPDRQSDKDPTHILFISEREPKPQQDSERKPATKPRTDAEAGDHGGIVGGDWPRRGKAA